MTAGDHVHGTRLSRITETHRAWLEMISAAHRVSDLRLGLGNVVHNDRR